MFSDKTEESINKTRLFFKESLEVNQVNEIFNIIGYDLNDKIHPNSFELDCFHGRINYDDIHLV